MNFFSHAYRFLDTDPYFLAGTSVPDWLGMIDRKTRVRRAAAQALIVHADPHTRSLAQGIVQHHDDDAWFHQTAAFSQLHMAFTRQLGDLLNGEVRFRPHFVAHIALEMLLDAALTENEPNKLDHYYQQIRLVDSNLVETIVNQIAPKSTDRLAGYLPRYVDQGFLYDYLRDDGVAYRVNRILTAIGLNALPNEFEAWVAEARICVRRSQGDLLQPPADRLQCEPTGFPPIATEA